ncbi:hypothetical protein [Nonomuraea sp. NPDC049158]|uniref:hypothetical protein n=1 Tax=Nonomuraea sp. NPDC049158 TaxID=3155649 RepID=UPI0033E8A78B
MSADRYRVVVNGHSAKKTLTRRGAESWAQLARDHNMSAHVEKTSICPTCGLHGCPGGRDCPDAGDAA